MATPLASHLVLDLGRALYVGALDVVPRHRAAAAAIVIGLDGPFDLITDDEAERRDAASIPPLTDHALACHGGRTAVLYFEPGTRRSDAPLDARTLAPLVEAATTDPACWDALLAAAAISPVDRTLDRRVAAVAAALRDAPDEATPATALAASVGLSVSRLEHLFKQQLGVPLRSYRGWFRLRRAAELLLEGATATAAAHAAGYHDQAHFTHAFRHSFGLPPSFVFASGAVRGYTTSPR